MSELTKIEWADSTASPWTGCTPVSAGCDHCYARTLAFRYGWCKALAAALECGHVRRVISDRALAELAASGLLVPPAKPPRMGRRGTHAADAMAPDPEREQVEG